MKNPRITKKEQGLLKGAVRRVFSRSDLRKQALEKVLLKQYYDPTRPRVKKWGTCELCLKIIPAYQLEIDHILPIVPVNTAFEDMTMDDIVNNLWCDVKNLQAACETCHKIKSGQERKLRLQYKKEKKLNGKSK